MRESLRDIDRLQHIRERIDNVMSFLEGKTFEDMKSHGYYTTSPIFIWETYTNDLPILLQQVTQFINEIESEQ